jgi:hypothetical protein
MKQRQDLQIIGKPNSGIQEEEEIKRKTHFPTGKSG